MSPQRRKESMLAHYVAHPPGRPDRRTSCGRAFTGASRAATDQDTLCIGCTGVLPFDPAEVWGGVTYLFVAEDPSLPTVLSPDEFERSLARLKGQQYFPRTDGRYACGLTPEENVECIEEAMCLDHRDPVARAAWEERWNARRINWTPPETQRRYYYTAPASGREMIVSQGVEASPIGLRLYFEPPPRSPAVDIWEVDGEGVSVRCENALVDATAVSWSALGPEHLRLIGAQARERHG